jgi:hypothetical protein
MTVRQVNVNLPGTHATVMIINDGNCGETVTDAQDDDYSMLDGGHARYETMTINDGNCGETMTDAQDGDYATLDDSHARTFCAYQSDAEYGQVLHHSTLPPSNNNYTSLLRLGEMGERACDDRRMYVTLNNYAVPFAALDLDGDTDDADPYYLTPSSGPGEPVGRNPLGWDAPGLPYYSVCQNFAGSSASQLDRRHKLHEPTACTRCNCSRWLFVLLVCVILAGAIAGGILGFYRRKQSTDDEGSVKAQAVDTSNVTSITTTSTTTKTTPSTT